MNKKGFTLIEVLVVITIIGILTSIAIPASQGIAKKINEKSFQTKIKLASEGAKLWGEDNNVCFTCLEGTCPVACEDLDCIYETDDEKICTITMGALAKNQYFKYDDETNKTIIDPRNKNKILNDESVTIIYYKKNVIVNTYSGNYLYNLSFDGNGSTGTMNSIKCIYDKLCSIPDNQFESTTSDFAGWSLTSSGSVKYNNSDSIKITEDTTLYAKWSLKKYTLSFDGNGSTGTMNSIICEHNQPCLIPDNGLEKIDHKFMGWSTTLNGEVEYNSGDSLKIINNTTLYAKWLEVDNKPPIITFSNFKTLQPGTDIYSSPIAIKVNASDPSGVKTIKYCTTSSTSCTPTNTITNNTSVSITGSTTTFLDKTICAIASDNLDNIMTTPTCETYKVDNYNPSLTCSSTGSWSNTTSSVSCTGTDNAGIRKLEWGLDNINWTTFSNININGPFTTPVTASFNTLSYQNKVKVTDVVGRTYTRNCYSKIDKAPPIAITVDIKGTLSDPSNNVSNIVCTNNEYLADDSINPDYEMYANNECTVYTRTNNPWQIWWYWNDDWTGINNSGYSGVDYLTYNGSCSSSYYTGGNISCMDARTGRSIYMYAVDAAGNKGIYYFKMTIR